VANPKEKKNMMVNIIKRHSDINSMPDRISHLMEIDYKKFNINVNVSDIFLLAEWNIEKIYTNQQTGFTELVKNLKSEYQIKRLSVSYQSLKPFLKIALPTWAEASRSQGLLRGGLNPRLRTMAESHPDPSFKKLVEDVLREFRNSTGLNV
jgi:hypothetical protein